MAMLDTLFDDFPLGYPSLRIPPLQDPFPDLSAQSARLSPLEPNARVDENIDNGTSKLTGRRKALAEAKPIGELTGSNDLRPIQRNPRKKPKLHEHERIADFVQLPQPNAKAKNDKPPPFQPVSILNELLEPPPSAALFPPITPKEGHGEPKRRSPTLSQSPCRGDGTPSSRTNATQKTIESPSSKRTSQRPRRKWTTQETEQLMKGIQLYGVGKWKKILHHPGFSFQPGRTPVDLKDHFRTKQKSIHDPEHVSVRKGTWTTAEDADLERGYRKHGFCWTSIAQDPDLNISHRTGPQVRDRFRTKFPELYSGDVKQDPSKRRPLLKSIHRKGTWNDAEDADLEKGYQKHGFSWARIVTDPELSLGHKTGPQVRDRFRTRFPEMYAEDIRHSPSDGAPRKKKKNHKPEQSDQPADVQATEQSSHKRSAIDLPDTTAGAQELEDRDHSSDESAIVSENDNDLARPKETVSPGNLSVFNSGTNNIMALLNSDMEDDRPSSSLRLDGWDANVTLAPLLWEEMATRPMFDLE